MTDLHRRAMARLPLTEAEVERLYASFRAGPDDVSVWAHMRAHMRQVLESHERLRTELAGAESLAKGDRTEVAAVLADLDELAGVWGEPVAVRRCRERLRKLVEAYPK